MSDLISRQAVIDRINRLIEVEKKQGTDDWGYGLERVKAYEAMLYMVKSEYLHPSVEPEKCGDCISRKAAFKALQIKGDYDTLNEVYDRLEKLPSVEPERKPGEWKYIQYDGNPKIGNWHCSECKRIVFLLHSQKQNEKPLYDFCPWCGAKMEVENEPGEEREE